MLSGYPPYNGDNNKEVIQSVIKNSLQFNHPGFDNVSKDSKEMIISMLEKNPKKRILLKDMLQ